MSSNRLKSALTKQNKAAMAAFLSFLFLFRLGYGLCSEFWFDDELQIYLIGLKFFTTGHWPFYGPDVVYTHTQIAGALQGLLVGGPLCLFPFPETPIIFVNLLSFASLCLMGWYISRRFPSFPRWMIFAWIMLAPWTINYGTRVVNPSYVLIFSIPFFVSFLDMFANNNQLISRRLSFFIFGLMPAFIAQIHLSWILLLPFVGLAFLGQWKSDRSKLISSAGLFIAGLVAGLSTLIPTFLQSDVWAPGVGSNVVFNSGNFKNIFTVLTRYLSFASFETNYWLGGNTESRLEVIRQNLWMAPVTIFLLIAGFSQVLLFVIAFFQKNSDYGWKQTKRITLATFLLVFFSFFFSIKGPSSHTFYLVMPIPFFYSFYCYEWLFKKRIVWKKLFIAMLICGLLFNTGLALYSFNTRSLYLGREKVKTAIEQKDYKLLGKRRSDDWGYGY